MGNFYAYVFIRSVTYKLILCGDKQEHDTHIPSSCLYLRGSKKEASMGAADLDILPKAKDVLIRVAEAEGAKAEERRRAAAAAEAEKKALLDQLKKPSGLSEDEKIRRAATVIERAVKNGLTEVQVYRFPNEMCTDRGRAINQGEPGWENTLTGIPREMFQLWKDHLQPRGYKIRYQIIDFPGGMPGDIGVILSWH
jgi:hypothetical protein